MASEIAGYQVRDTLPVPVPVSRALAGLHCRLGPLTETEECAVVNWGYAVADAAMFALGVPGPRPVPRWPYPTYALDGGVVATPPTPEPSHTGWASGIARAEVFSGGSGGSPSYNGVMILGRPDTIIVVAPELVTFYEFVKPRQETEYGSLVVLLDRRQQERRQASVELELDRRNADRRAPPSGSARAQLSVLGFTVLHRVGEQYEA